MSGTAGTIGGTAGGVAGGALGGVIGGILGGPIGAWIGRGIGSRVGRAAGAAAAGALSSMMEGANEDAEVETSEASSSAACADCGEIECFDPPEGSTPEEIEEFQRQLDEQAAGINNMDPDKLITNMDQYAQFGRPATDAAARRAVVPHQRLMD